MPTHGKKSRKKKIKKHQHRKFLKITREQRLRGKKVLIVKKKHTQRKKQTTTW